MTTDARAGVDIELQRFVRRARRRNVNPLLLDVLIDHCQPDVARHSARPGYRAPQARGW